MKSLRLLACTILVTASFAPLTAKAQQSIAEQQDAEVIDNLRHNGADVTKVHDIDFFFVFNRQADAAQASANIRMLGYKVISVHEVPAVRRWEVHAKRNMVPDLRTMQATTRVLQALAEAHGGYYDGWGTVGVR